MVPHKRRVKTALAAIHPVKTPEKALLCILDVANIPKYALLVD
jgi:hypothetical protein